MLKALLTALLLVPFFIHANIFSDGTVILKNVKTSNTHCAEKKSSVYKACGNSFVEAALTACDMYAATFPDYHNGATGYSTVIEKNNYHCVYENSRFYLYYDKTTTYPEDQYGNPEIVYGPTPTYSFEVNMVDLGQQISKTCPPETDLTATYAIDNDLDGEPDSCADPDQINLVDECNASSGNTVLNLQVTDQNACYTTSNGSICEYQAVDVGGGNQVYEMNLEGDCYSEPKPDISGNPSLGDEPVSGCVNNGGLVSCPADPDVVCPDGNCQDGCGYMNDSFVCYDVDTDSDGLPDYNDPDIDGDGVANDDDLDSDGDGQDDPIDGGGSSPGGGGSTVNVDMSGVISELQKANTSLDNIESAFDTGHGQTPDDLDKDGRMTELNNDYQNNLDNFIAKGSDELGYVDKLEFTNEGKLRSLIPTTDGCQNYVFPVGHLGEFDLDICAASEKIRPLLYWFFAMLTVFYVFHRVNSTVRGAK